MALLSANFLYFFFAHYYLEDRSAGRVVGGFTNILVRGSNYLRKRVGALHRVR